MTTQVRGLPAFPRVASAVAPVELVAGPRIAVDAATPVTPYEMTAGNAELVAILRDQASIEAAAIATTRMPRV